MLPLLQGVDRVYKQLGAAHAKDATQWDYKVSDDLLDDCHSSYLLNMMECTRLSHMTLHALNEVGAGSLSVAF
jgi:hypothetical protein